MEASGSLCLGRLDWCRYGCIAGRVVVIMITKHTLGPWKAVRNASFWEVVTPSTGQRLEQANEYSPSLAYVWGEGEEQAEANARLIAAAPDLLEVLELCEGNISSLLASAHPKVYGKWLSVVKAAIAKAKGETK